MQNNFTEYIFIIMKSVFEYINYRECTRDFYEEQKARKALSWASFAESAGIKSPVFLQYVCEGKKNLGERTAPQVADAMGLAGFESTFFCKLVALDNAKSESDKKEILESIAELARVHKVKPITAEEYQFFKSWKNSLIRELAPCMDGANPKEISRATRYRVKTGEVREILEFLQEAGYLTQDAQGNYRQADRSLRMGSEARNSASKTVQKAIAHDLQVQMAELAVDALKNDPAQGRNITGLTLGITREAYGQIVEELAECRRRIVAIATESARTEEVYRLNMQLFPLSDMHKEGFIQDSPSSKGVKDE